MTDVVMDEVDEVDEGGVQAKLSEEQLGQIFNEILIFNYNCINLFIHYMNDRYCYG